MTEKKPKPDPLVAATNILIDGKAFEAGERITGVAKEQIDIAANQKRVVRRSVYEQLAEGVPAPELGGHETDFDDADDSDGAGDTGGAGDNGGAGQ